MEVDWTHPKESRNKRYKASFKLEPQGQRKRGRPKSTWRRGNNSELNKIGMTWNETKTKAKDRVDWKGVVVALCPSTDNME